MTGPICEMPAARSADVGRPELMQLPYTSRAFSGVTSVLDYLPPINDERRDGETVPD